MASSTAFEATYLTASAATRIPVSAGRGQVAGSVYNLRRSLQEGNATAVAHAVVDNPRVIEAVDRASRLMSLPALKVDYLAIDSA